MKNWFAYPKEMAFVPELMKEIEDLQKQITALKEELKKVKSGGTVIHNHYHYPYYGYWYYPTGPRWTLSSTPNSTTSYSNSTISYLDSMEDRAEYKAKWGGSNWQSLTGKLESNTKG